MLIGLTGMSGAGKSTVVNRAIQGRDDMCFSTSVTTRAPRPGEVDGKDYFFIDEERFQQMAERGELLEHGVKIYKYTPGFLHAKSVLVDREVALVGSTNMDHRTFQLQYECAALLYHLPAVEELLEDMDEIMAQSAPYTLADWKKRSRWRRMWGFFFRIIAIWL